MNGENVVDVNVWLFDWPFRRFPWNTTAERVEKLKAESALEVWAGSFEGLFHKDQRGVNDRLASECRAIDVVRVEPAGSINPALPGWQWELERCVNHHAMRVIRLAPGYHGYTLEGEPFTSLLKAAAERGLVIQIVVEAEEPRTQSHLARVAPVDVRPLAGQLANAPRARVILLNAHRSIQGGGLDVIAALDQVWVDLGMLEGATGLTRLMQAIPVERILFGSHFPFFNWEAAHLKLLESPIGEAGRGRISRANARAMLGRETSD